MEIKVDKKISPEEALKSTGRKQYINDEVVKNAPRIEGGKLEFFKIDKNVTTEELGKEYESRGLVPADLYTLCAFDVRNPEKMDEMKYVATQWKDKNGKWCFASFYLWYDERRVRVGRDDRYWGGYWWFGGRRKSSSKNSEPKTFPSESLNLENFIKDLEKLIDKYK